MPEPNTFYKQPYQAQQATGYENYSKTTTPGHHLDSKPFSIRNQRNHLQPAQVNLSNQPSRSPNSRFIPYEQSHHHHHASTVPSGPQAYGQLKQDPSGAKSGKQKLPHGLTVYELKEMTKARLHAEAVDRIDTDRKESAFENRGGFSPVEFESPSEARERAMSRDSASRNNHVVLRQGSASDSITSIPSMVQVNQPSREGHHGRQPNLSPLHPRFQSFVPFGSATPSNDAGSVGQTGVESSSQEDRSPPSSALASPSNSSFFDSTIGSGNRRRALTSSPKQGLIHEDRPHLSGELMLSSFTSSNRSTLVPRVRNSYSPVLGQLGLDGTRLNQKSGMVEFYDFNRPRTSSATSLPLAENMNRPRTSSTTSLPPISRTGDEFATERPNNLFQLSGTYPRSRNESLPEDLATSFAESPLSFQPSNGRVRASPGFSRSAENVEKRSNTAFSRVGNIENLASGWQANEGMIRSLEDRLLNDMGSILRLSDEADRPDRERSNTYPHTSKATTDTHISGDFGGGARYF